MITALLASAFVALLLAMALNVPAGLAYVRRATPRQKLLAFAWFAMFIGQAQIIAHDASFTGIGSLEGGRVYQLLWMFVAGIVSLQLVLTSKVVKGAWRFAIIALFAYCFFAIASAAFSPAKALTLYKSAQVIIDAFLVVVSCSELIRARSPHFLVDITLTLVALLLLGVLAGGLFVPESAFIANEGALGKSLRGVVPAIHPNELGLMAAIGLVVGLVRVIDPSYGKLRRMLWLALALAGFVVLFLAQARTSLAGAALAVILSGFLLKRLRPLSWTILIASIAVVAYYQLGGGSLGIEDKVTLYVTRGVSDEHIKNLSGRTELWAAGWEMFKDAPLFGHGFSAGVRMLGPEYGIPFGINMHSSHMQVLVDVGLVGYLAWISFVISASVIIFRNIPCFPQGSRGRSRAAEAGLITFVILFRSFLGHVLVTHQYNLMIFLSIYIYAVVSDAMRKDNPEISPDPVPGREQSAGLNGGARILARKASPGSGGQGR